MAKKTTKSSNSGSLDVLIKKQIREYHERKAKLFMDMALSEMIEHYGIEHTKKVLADYIDQLSEFR